VRTSRSGGSEEERTVDGTAQSLVKLVDGLFNSSPHLIWKRRTGTLPIRITRQKEITMNDHCGHTKHTSAKPESTSKSIPPAPVKPDPHAGHDMGKSKMPATPPKPGDNK
jgi:hypothetical protein